MSTLTDIPRKATDFEYISDAIDEVNILKKSSEWDGSPRFNEDKDKSKFRQYETACNRVKAFYKEQHEKQTLEFNLQIRSKFRKQIRARMSVWEAMELLNTLVDDSDPDTSLSQIEHLVQTAEAIRRDGKPEWMQVVGLVHDLGKLLFFFGSEGQWDVVGDTFVVGCKFPETIIYHETFNGNLDFHHPIYSTECGIYEPGCGLDKVMISWGHDEYLYQICKAQSTLPQEGLAMIRYHSFYPWHREGAYRHLMETKDYQALDAVKAFNPYDLYSKTDERTDPNEVRPYYEKLIANYFPSQVEW
ncbi:hypothetical protein Clacol_007490 [Clathrus columnatus]|uniref:Inositol oxygenase n=1 Tax=Clathrus columnatus TaxID=1419009 RepID=A0AAV5AKL7_9AGAM|nr:hypothetical protein Clacol_007490 [Clathrus columnatus]